MTMASITSTISSHVNPLEVIGTPSNGLWIPAADVVAAPSLGGGMVDFYANTPTQNGTQICHRGCRGLVFGW